MKELPVSTMKWMLNQQRRTIRKLGKKLQDALAVISAKDAALLKIKGMPWTDMKTTCPAIANEALKITSVFSRSKGSDASGVSSLNSRAPLCEQKESLNTEQTL